MNWGDNARIMFDEPFPIADHDDIQTDGFYARPSAHLGSLATGHGLGTISAVQALFASFRAVTLKPSVDTILVGENKLAG